MLEDKDPEEKVGVHLVPCISCTLYPLLLLLLLHTDTHSRCSVCFVAGPWLALQARDGVFTAVLPFGFPCTMYNAQGARVYCRCWCLASSPTPSEPSRACCPASACSPETC